jgi:hydrogenase maturation factor
MNLIYGEIVDVPAGPGPRLGKIRVGGAVRIISLDLLTDPAPGDKVLTCEGAALGKVEGPVATETAYVPGHTR